MHSSITSLYLYHISNLHSTSTISSQLTMAVIIIAAIISCLMITEATAFVIESSPARIKKLVPAASYTLTPCVRYYAIAHEDRLNRSGTLLRASSSAIPMDGPIAEQRSTYKLSIPLPLGLVLEEVDIADPSHGVVIVGISPDGNAAQLNSKLFSDKSLNSTIGQKCICIRDKVISVNGTLCNDCSLEDVIQLITKSNDDNVVLEIGRIQQSTVLHYSQGRCIAAKPGESYGFLAQKCGARVMYECRTGNCLTCAKRMEFPDKMNSEEKGNLYERTILNCVGTVPRNYEWLNIIDE